MESNDATVLVVDDIAANRNVLGETLESEGYEVLLASSGETSLKVARKAMPDVILLDIMMPGMDGFEVCRQLKLEEQTKHIPVIFITANNDMSSFVQGFRVGGVDYITKPFHAEEVLMRVGNHVAISRLTRDLKLKNEALRKEIERREVAESDRDKADGQLSVIEAREVQRWGIKGFVGQSATFKQILDSIHKLSRFSSASVLITGESGTGKELVARAIHFSGDQSKSPFIPVNCSSIPNELAESLFFGHVKGAFSGATSDRKGYFQLADGGTLFLDEVGDMPMELQSVLLRVLEDGEVRPVGSSRSERVQVRVVAASNVNFQQSISNGTFRKDLFFRLARFTIEVPPLRERQDDVPLLVKHFLELFADELNIPQPEVSVDALQRLCQYTYPGNIRELKNILERAVIESGNEGQIDKSALHFFYEETGFDAVEDSETEVSVSELPPDEQNDETTILDYVKTHGIINNTVCRQLLDVDRNRSSYLLRKLEKQDKLISEGQGRWAQYRLSNSDANQTQRSC